MEEEKEEVQEENNKEPDLVLEDKEPVKEKKGGKGVILIALLLLLVVACGVYFLLSTKKKDEKEPEVTKTSSNEYTQYQMKGNDLNYFDLSFLKFDSASRNKVYSPLSIKYALEMLAEGAKGQTRDEVLNVIGKYKVKKYTNNENLSFANALFVRDSYKSNVKESYVNTLKNNFAADVIYDSFDNPDVLNNWVSDKTFKLINKMFDDVSRYDYIITNALAIDMEWKNKISSSQNGYNVYYPNEDYIHDLLTYDESGYQKLKFGEVGNVNALEIGASINRYDIVKEIGEENIRKTVKEEYEKWINDVGKEPYCDRIDDMDTYLNDYIKDLNSNYKQVASSTDYTFYSDDEYTAFAKELKQYGDMTLEYIGIMPKKVSLDNFVKDLDVDVINKVVNNLKEVKLENFKDGVITKVTGSIPVFNYNYKINLIEELKNMGINKVFTEEADLSNLTSSKSFISDATHEATIEFSNDGIKAAAATAFGGRGAGGCFFEYLYKVPVEEINLTFDKPFIYIIRDKATNEVWFTGTVYEPTAYTEAE